MLPSMFSGISGLKANQRKLDIVGNNISNASTTSYKSESMRFQDMISQSVTQATGANANIGGTNPRQIGLGVQIAGIARNTSVGNMQSTSRLLDVSIDGPGYFVVGSGPLPADSGATDAGTIEAPEDTHQMAANSVETKFTRDGSFSLDTQGNLLTGDGLRVYGYANTKTPITYSTDTNNQHSITVGGIQDLKDAAEMTDTLVPLVIPDSIDVNGTNVRVQSFSIGKDGIITASLSNNENAVIGQVAMASFKNEAGLSKMGRNLYSATANSGEPLVRSKFGADPANDNSKGYGEALQGMLEMSNVDLAEQFTEMIIASRAFQANGKIISTGDEILQDLVNLKR